MVATTFDTHEAVKRLKESGFDTDSAEAITDTLREAVDARAVTRNDIGELRDEMGKMEVRLTTRIYATAVVVGFGNAALTAALIQLF